MYTLYSGFKKVGQYSTILTAKAKSLENDGVYNLKGESYRDSWQILNGAIYEG